MQTKITINLPDEDEALASTAVVRQSHTLLYRSLAVHEPTVVFVRRGRKKLRWAGRELVVEAGGAAALAGWQTFDVMNEPDEGGLYQAQWIAFGQGVIERFAAQYGAAEAVRDAAALPQSARMDAAFDYAASALAGGADVPRHAAESALHGLLAWLQHYGIGFAVHERLNLTHQIRKLIAADTAADWSAAMLAGRLHCSEATLRRRLAKQGTGFRTLLTDVRMTRALTLLQVTPWPVAQITGAVGYESPSRFAARFKERFGFAPSAVRAESEEEAAYRLAGPVSVGIRP